MTSTTVVATCQAPPTAISVVHAVANINGCAFEDQWRSSNMSLDTGRIGVRSGNAGRFQELVDGTAMTCLFALHALQVPGKSFNLLQ